MAKIKTTAAFRVDEVDRHAARDDEYRHDAES
jgi:hypothetical protein